MLTKVATAASFLMSGSLLRLFYKFDPEMPRNLLKSVLLNANVTATITKVTKTMPTHLEAPFRMLEVLVCDPIVEAAGSIGLC